MSFVSFPSLKMEGVSALSTLEVPPRTGNVSQVSSFIPLIRYVPFRYAALHSAHSLHSFHPPSPPRTREVRSVMKRSYPGTFRNSVDVICAKALLTSTRIATCTIDPNSFHSFIRFTCFRHPRPCFWPSFGDLVYTAKIF